MTMSYFDRFRASASDFEKNALENFLRYLRIPTTHPNVDYGPCEVFLREQAQSMDLVFNSYYYYEGNPVIVLTWFGEQPNLPSILLNSHMDVVSVDETQWKHKPFAAEIDDQGDIYARGAQDTKAVGIQYLEAIRQLKNNNVALKRTVHITFVPDEEVGGHKGMKSFVESEEFKNLNVGFALDEGTPSEADEYLVSYGEKSAHSIVFHCPGQTGHGSLLLKNTAGEKLYVLLNKLYSLRAQSEKNTNGELKLYGEHVTVNVTKIEGGTEANVLPQEIKLTVDCRLPPTISLKSWEETLDAWCKEAGEGVSMEYLYDSIHTPITKLDDNNEFWVAFKNTADLLKMNIVPWILPGGTDSRYLRNVGIPAIGFAPLRFTKFRLHEVDEYLNVKIFLDGIDIYSKIISAMSCV